MISETLKICSLFVLESRIWPLDDSKFYTLQIPTLTSITCRQQNESLDKSGCIWLITWFVPKCIASSESADVSHPVSLSGRILVTLLFDEVRHRSSPKTQFLEVSGGQSLD